VARGPLRRVLRIVPRVARATAAARVVAEQRLGTPHHGWLG